MKLLNEEQAQKRNMALVDLSNNMCQAWPDLFCFHQITDQDIKEIIGYDENGKIIGDTNSESSDNARRAILKLYTYESPLYKTLNTASCHRDERVVPTLGPFAHLLY